jgi:hypothetical protein
MVKCMALQGLPFRIGRIILMTAAGGEKKR